MEQKPADLFPPIEQNTWLNWALLLEELQKPIYTKRDLTISYSTLQEWAKHGLATERENNNNWHKFNFIEYIWMLLVVELKAFGMPTKSVKKLKEALFEHISVKELLELQNQSIQNKDLDQTEREIINSYSPEQLQELQSLVSLVTDSSNDLTNIFTPFMLMIARYIGSRNNVFLMIDNAGNVLPYMEERTQVYQHYEYLQEREKTHISVSLKALLKGFITTERGLKNASALFLLNAAEQKIVNLIREGGVTALTVRFDNQERISLIETKKNLDIKEIEGKLVDYIMEMRYAEIEITTSAGKVVKFNRTKKYKPDQ